MLIESCHTHEIHYVIALSYKESIISVVFFFFITIKFYMEIKLHNINNIFFISTDDNYFLNFNKLIIIKLKPISFPM